MKRIFISLILSYILWLYMQNCVANPVIKLGRTYTPLSQLKCLTLRRYILNLLFFSLNKVLYLAAKSLLHCAY